jgi:hypothetical protein
VNGSASINGIGLSWNNNDLGISDSAINVNSTGTSYGVSTNQP